MDEKISKELAKRTEELCGNRHQYSPSEKSRQKRPYRLIPAHKTQKPDDDGNNLITQQPLQFYGPLANCSDLSKLGYTLNGFYQVSPYNINTNSNDIKIETIYCTFKQPEDSFKSSRVEKRILGKYLKVCDDSNEISNHFHVEMVLGQSDQITRFDKTLLF